MRANTYKGWQGQVQDYRPIHRNLIAQCPNIIPNGGNVASIVHLYHYNDRPEYPGAVCVVPHRRTPGRAVGKVGISNSYEGR